jgi:hypothetical protein
LQQGAEQGCALVILDGSLFDWDRLDETTTSDEGAAIDAAASRRTPGELVNLDAAFGQ